MLTCCFKLTGFGIRKLLLSKDLINWILYIQYRCKVSLKLVVKRFNRRGKLQVLMVYK
jgi:hypothetical protein